MRNIISTFLFAAIASTAFAQTSFEEIKADPSKVGSLYYLYPQTERIDTKAPKGYKPFYISHYGRHGSRYLVQPDDYIKPLTVFQNADKAGKLTDAGKEVLRRLTVTQQDANEREGELTEVGVAQHRGIAQRMYNAVPEVFKGNPVMTAKSTTRMRCAHSMMAFCEALKELSPNLVIPKESAKRYMYYLSRWTPEAAEFNRWDGPAATAYRSFADEMAQSDRLMNELFNDQNYVASSFNAKELMRQLFLIAIDLPNTECPERLDDIFTVEELYNLWQAINAQYYITMGNPTAANGVILNNALPLLKNIVESADAMIASGKNGADLRFGHDSTIVPLTGLMRIDGCYGSVDDPHQLADVYADFKISPMAANLQLIFYRDKKGDVIVKLMLNEREVSILVETDIAPFYHWADVKTYFENILNN